MARSGTVLRNMMVVGLMHSQSELSPASLPLSGLRRTDTSILSSFASAAISSPAAPMAQLSPFPLHTLASQEQYHQYQNIPPLFMPISGGATSNPVLPSSRTKTTLALRDSDAPPRLGKRQLSDACGRCPRPKAACHRALDGSGRRSGERPHKQQGQITRR